MVPIKTAHDLRQMGLKTIQELETDFGILASGKDEIFGCLFGRDSLITALKLLRAYRKKQNPYFLSLVKKILINLSYLQGKSTNIESGEEPGKIIHEFRTQNHEHLTQRHIEPWYVYPGDIMKNYDSIDSTPLFLIAVYRYLQMSGSAEFQELILPSVFKALEWILFLADANGDGFFDYQFHPHRKFGGLRAQSWMDSTESIFHEDEKLTPYPIAPCEVQGYCFLALKLWAHFFQKTKPDFSAILLKKANLLKEKFNQEFVLGEGSLVAWALDGNLLPLTSARSSMGHLLWAAKIAELDENLECILKQEYVPKIVNRLMADDLFEPEAGIRTLSKNSPQFDPVSYHNGSIWPHDTAIIAEGFENFGFVREANLLRRALKSAWQHFGTPVELFVYNDRGFKEYRSATGQQACSKQAWSAASILAEV